MVRTKVREVVSVVHPRPRTCPYCNAVFNGPSPKQALDRHMADRHLKPATNGNGGKRATAVVHSQKMRATNQVVLPHPVRSLGSANAEFTGLAGRARQLGESLNYKQMLTKSLGTTPEGRTWALTALHPCGEGEIVSDDLGNLAGMPDTMTGSVVTPNYRSETVIAFDGTIFPTPPVDPSGTWGIDIVIPPIPEIDYIYRLRYDPTSLVSDWVVVRTPNFKITVGTPTVEPSGPTMALLGYGKSRCIGLGHTFELDSSATTNQGRVIVGQLQGQWDRKDISVTGVAMQVATTNNTIHPIDWHWPVISADNSMTLWALSVPTDETVLTSACPTAYQEEAKNGAYVPTKFSSPLLGYPFKDTGDYGNIQFDWEFNKDASATWQPPNDATQPRAQFLPSTAFCINGSAKGGQLLNAEIFDGESGFYQTGILPLLKAPNAGSPGDVSISSRAIHPYVSPPSDMMTSVVLFRNLLVGPAIGGTSAVRVKGRQHFECIASGNNPGTAPFVHPPAPYDLDALENVVVAGKRMADAYPASYNASGDILGDVWSLLKGVASPLTKTISGMNIPIVSDIARLF